MEKQKEYFRLTLVIWQKISLPTGKAKKCEWLIFYGAGGRNRTDMGWKPRGILSPVRLPISPLRHDINIKKIVLHVKLYGINVEVKV